MRGSKTDRDKKKYQQDFVQHKQNGCPFIPRVWGGLYSFLSLPSGGILRQAKPELENETGDGKWQILPKP